MRKVKVITDSCSDLTPELMERYGIDYAKMNTVYGGKASPADLAWTPEDVRALYGIMREGNRVTTTQVPADEFDRVFRHWLGAGYDVVYVGCSSKQSGSVGTARVMAKKILPDYPGAAIVCVDSLHACMGEGMVAIEGAKKAAEGASAAEVGRYCEERRKYIHQFCTVHSLDALRRAGRVKASSAFFGNLLGVKPVIVADADGEQAAFRKVKGRTASLREIVSLLGEHMTDPESQTVYVAHSDCPEEEVEQVKAFIREIIPCKDIYTGYIGPIIGASIGPGAFAIFGIGKEITYRIGKGDR